MSLSKPMRQLRRLRYLLFSSFVISIFVCTLMLVMAPRSINWSIFLRVLFLIIILGPNLMHIYVSYSLAKNYFPQKEVPRSFIISFRIVSVFAWIVCLVLIIVIIYSTIEYIYSEPNTYNWRPLAIPFFASFILLVCLMPFQFIAASRLLSTIQGNHKKSLLESFT